MSENQLIAKAQAGDPAAFGELYSRHASKIYRFIFLKTGHTSDTEDMLHEVFLAAWRTMPGYQREVGIPFTSWLYRIAQNRVIDYYRTQKKNISLDEILHNNILPVELVSTAHHNLEHALHHQFEMQKVVEAMQKLKDDQQSILIMRYAEDLSPNEIAAALGKTSGSVRLIQHRALKQLKALMKKQTHGNRIPHQTT